MRNLKKILALVLALIMSLSLMATAGATDFKDDADVAQSNYRQAVEVLSGLGVFNGDQYGNFNPGQPITRAEVAAILYRIGTGDTSLDGNKTYAPYNQFTDVQSEDWYAGYVTYCANAGWIKGRSNNDFDPKANVTGYEVLAMILRAVGYDKNAEFVGKNWQLNTASIAREKGVLVNVIEDTSVQLSADASRAVVAELLLRSMLLNKVSFSTATLSYNDLDERVCDILGLKEVTGVVVSNADADLLEYADISVKDTQTVLWVDAVKGSDIEKDDLVTLNIASGLEDIGEMRTAYMQKTPSRATYEPVVEELYPVDTVSANNDYKGGAAGATTSVGKVADELDTEYIRNYADYDEATNWQWYSNGIRIRYVIGYTGSNAKATAENMKKINDTRKSSDGRATYAESYVVQVDKDNQAQYPGQAIGTWVYDRIIHIDQELTGVDYVNIYDIFNNADKYNTPSGDMAAVAHGEVYVGTASVEDKSDTMRWTAFEKEYLVEGYTTGLTIENGNYVKVIDYDNDGYADFALKREYYLDRVASVYNNTVYHENADTEIGTGRSHETFFKTGTSVVYAEGVEPKAGDVILRNFIDGTWYGEIVEPVTITVKTVDWKNNKIIDTDGNEWFASGIALCADMDYDILVMNEQVQYNLYLDKGGYIRAYELAQGSNYALLTEMYPTGRNNGAFVTNDNWIAEVMRVDDKYPAEYSLLNSYTNGTMNPFIDDARNKTPFNVSTPGVNNIVDRFYIDYLQQAIGHLTPSLAWTDARDVTAASAGTPGNGDEFKWTPTNPEADVESWTNVGKYIMTENGVNLYTATETATKNGAQLYYAWVDLDDDGVVDSDEKFDVLDIEAVTTANADKDIYSILRKGQKVTLADWEKFVDSLNATDASAAAKAVWAKLQAETVAKYTSGNKTYPVLYPVYAVDYIKLAQKDVAAAAKHYDIAAENTEVFAHTDGTYASKWSYAAGNNTNAAKADSYSYLNNDYVDSVDDTEYYLVSGDSIRTFVGYKNVPAIDDQYIRAIYAVAENTTADLNQNDYWVARVIVIELEGAYSFDSISLVYYNPYQTTSQVHGYDTLNNEAEDVNLRVHPQNEAWGAQGSKLGFFGLVGQDSRDDISTASNMVLIDGDQYKFNANHIFAGEIARDKTINQKGNYFDIYTDNEGINPNRARGTLPVNVPIYGLFSYNANGRTVVVADGPHNIVENVINPGDRIIWVTDSVGNVAFVVDLDMVRPNTGYDYMNELDSTWLAIIAEQNPTAETPFNLNTLIADEAAYWAREAMKNGIDVTKLSNEDVTEGEKLLAKLQDALAKAESGEYNLSALDKQWLTEKIGEHGTWTGATWAKGSGLLSALDRIRPFAAANEKGWAAADALNTALVNAVKTLDATTHYITDYDAILKDATTDLDQNVDYGENHATVDAIAEVVAIWRDQLRLAAQADVQTEGANPTSWAAFTAANTLYAGRVNATAQAYYNTVAAAYGTANTYTSATEFKGTVGTPVWSEDGKSATVTISGTGVANGGAVAPLYTDLNLNTSTKTYSVMDLDLQEFVAQWYAKGLTNYALTVINPSLAECSTNGSSGTLTGTVKKFLNVSYSDLADLSLLLMNGSGDITFIIGPAATSNTTEAGLLTDTVTITFVNNFVGTK